MPLTISHADPVFIADWNEIGRLGTPDERLYVSERFIQGVWPMVLTCSLRRRYEVGEHLRVIDEDGGICYAEVVELRDDKLGHGYIVRPIWDSYTIARATATA